MQVSTERLSRGLPTATKGSGAVGQTSAKGPGAERSRAVRSLLARRMLEAKRRKEITEEIAQAGAGALAVQGDAALLKPLGPAAWKETKRI